MSRKSKTQNSILRKRVLDTVQLAFGSKPEWDFVRTQLLRVFSECDRNLNSVENWKKPLKFQNIDGSSPIGRTND